MNVVFLSLNFGQVNKSWCYPHCHYVICMHIYAKSLGQPLYKKEKKQNKTKKHTNIHLDKFINFRFILPQRSGRIIVVFTFVFSVEIAWHFSHISAAHFVQNLIILTELFAAFGALCDSSSWPSRVWCM